MNQANSGDEVKPKKPQLVWVQRILFVAGLISLIGLDQDIIRWSEVANWIVTFYQGLTGPLVAYLSALLGIQIPPLAVDILILAGVLFSAANIHSLRLRGTMVFWEALTIFVSEQLLQKSAEVRLKDGDLQYAAVAALVTITAAFCAPVLLIIAVFGGRAVSLDALPAWLFTIYLIWGFRRLSRLDDQVPHDAHDRFKSPQFRKFLINSLIFLPSSIYRYLTFIMYCVVFMLFSAWKWYLYVLASFVVVLIFNEIYLRFAKQWEVYPDCLVFSIQSTCSVAGIGVTT